MRNNAGLVEHIMAFEVEKVLEDSKWQAPAYCFKEVEKESISLLENLATSHFRDVVNGEVAEN